MKSQRFLGTGILSFVLVFSTLTNVQMEIPDVVVNIVKDSYGNSVAVLAPEMYVGLLRAFSSEDLTVSDISEWANKEAESVSNFGRLLLAEHDSADDLRTSDISKLRAASAARLNSLLVGDVPFEAELLVTGVAKGLRLRVTSEPKTPRFVSEGPEDCFLVPNHTPDPECRDGEVVLKRSKSCISVELTSEPVR
jgi:hypothetical protein